VNGNNLGKTVIQYPLIPETLPDLPVEVKGADLSFKGNGMTQRERVRNGVQDAKRKSIQADLNGQFMITVFPC
jgi:hypothetical protein